MTPGAIVDDDYPSDLPAPKRLLLAQHNTAKGVRYDCPVLAESLPEGASRLEVLLLGWALLLYRNSLGNHVQFSWRYAQTGTDNKTTLEVNTSKLQWSATDSVASALEAVRGYLRASVPDAVSADSYSFLLNDEFAPPGSFTPIKEGPIMDWGNIQMQASVSEGSLWLRPHWREPLGAEWLANHFAKSLVEILNTTVSNPDAPVGDVLRLGDVDAEVLWGWNKDVPEAVETCMHDLIDEQFKARPDAPAVCSWDGDLTYGDVDRYSNLLAHHLVDIGLQVGDVVPLCFEKSRWTIVAVMAVTRAGGAFVLTDPSQPLQRRQTMASQVRAKMLLTSRKQAQDGAATAPKATIVAVDEAFLTSLADAPAPESSLPVYSPEELLYCIFTSGSTGMPKGVMINHATYTTSALARAPLIGYTAEARALDFTSYAFDVSIDSMLCTLLQGGCLCIPGDEDRVNDLSGVMRRLGVNMANMTPSVARILDPDIIPSLNSLGLGGETCSAGDISIWGRVTRVVVGYGPSECTIGCTVNPSAAGKPYVSIGAATAGTIWLADPDDHNKLVPVGAVGELLVEGPVVGQGYLRDPEKTAAAFIEDPEWLLKGGPGVPGRRGRLYKTGDLVRYDPDGEVGFLFVGRKDTQIKLRGQRVELGEIEYHMMNLLPHATDVVAEIVAPKSNAKESMLVAFIADREVSGQKDDMDAQHIELPRRLREAVGLLDENLGKVLPVYMVPSAYIGMSKIPMLVSGKTDRKTLRALGAAMSLQTTPEDQGDISMVEPVTETETFLRDAWCRLLNLPTDQVSTSHNFFMLGGESVLAMKLVPMVREHGYSLSVPDVFNHPVLSDMAKVIQRQDEASLLDMSIPAFSLLSDDLDHDALLAEAAEQCKVDQSAIEDIYPCAPMQEIHVAFHNRSSEGYVAQRVAEIRFPDAVDRLKAAWDAVVGESPLLRTRIVEFKQHGFLQVVLNTRPVWKTRVTDLETFLEEDRREHMTPSTPLTRFAVVVDLKPGKLFFVWTAHHAIYDGWSTDLIVEHAQAAFQGESLPRPAEFRHFVRYVKDPAREASKDYWRAQLEGATGPQFPSLPSRSYMPTPDSLEQRFVSVAKSSRSDMTVATVIRAAWALVASQYVMSDDVVFGETFTGRTLPIPGAEQIEGPTLATVPVRIRVDRTASVKEFLQAVQEQSVERTAHEHLGIQNIRRLSDDAQMACEVTMGLVVQLKEPEEIEPTEDTLPLFRSGNAAVEALHFNSYPIMLACSLEDAGFTVYASFDSDLLSRPQVQRVLAQFETAVTLLRSDPDRSLSDVTCISDDELALVWQANRAGPVSLPNVSSRLASGDLYPAIRYVPWIAHPANPELLVPVGTVGELLVEGADEVGDVDTPEWLSRGAAGVPGRHGRLYRTGDLVRYTDDLSLVFVGRKEAMTSIDGRVVDLAATDAELEKVLPEGTVVASQLILPVGSTSQTPLVVAFVQERVTPETEMVSLEVTDSAIPLSATVSVSLASSVASLKKALVETLPPYAIPSVVIPVSSMSVEASNVTLSLVQDVRRAFASLNTILSTRVSLTSKERVLRAMWARFLDVDEAKLSLDDNFFHLGGDSIVAMRMVSALRRAGYKLNVADMFRNMQLRGMASALDDSCVEVEAPKKEYVPFSLVDVDVESIKALLADEAWTIQDVLPVTGPQEHDVKTTISTHRSSVQYNMLYFDASIDTGLLVASFQHLVSVHPILRTVFVEHASQTLQVVLDDMSVPVSASSTDSPVAAYCRQLAEADIASDAEFALGNPFLRLFVVDGVDEKALMIRLSHAQYDGVSLPELLRQLELQYRGEEIPSSGPFSSYLQYSAETKAEHVSFWRKTLSGSSLTEIASPAPASSTTAWMTKPVDVSSASPDTTLAVLLNAAWAQVQARHLSVSDVTFGGIVSGRDVSLSDVDSLMGPCYQYMPIRVQFQPGMTAAQLVDHVRTQYLEGSQRATLSFRDIQTECTSWSGETGFFGSFVNHLNKEFFDALPFGHTSCRVDYSIPHAEPATPPRVVSFVENGESFVGIEADEERREFWEARLDEVAAAVEGFVKSPEEVVL